MSGFSPDSFAVRLIAAVPQSHVSRIRHGRGGMVFRQGDVASAVYVVEQGRVRLSRMSADGLSLTLYVADRGETFAEASLSARHYHCDAIAETDAVVLAIPKADLLASMTSDPSQGLAVALALASQVRDLRMKLELRNIRSAPERLLAWLRLRATGNSPHVPLRRSWTLIADELGLTREAVYRALATLERQERIIREADGVRLR